VSQGGARGVTTRRGRLSRRRRAVPALAGGPTLKCVSVPPNGEPATGTKSRCASGVRRKVRALVFEIHFSRGHAPGKVMDGLDGAY